MMDGMGWLIGADLAAACSRARRPREMPIFK
jgi:hypothetical protein